MMLDMTQTLIYDADCGFCTRSAHWLRGEDAFVIASWQSIDDVSSLGLTQQMVEEAAHWCVDGRVAASGPDAIACAMIQRGRIYTLAGKTIKSKPVRPIASIVYRWVSRNRHAMPGGTAACRIDR